MKVNKMFPSRYLKGIDLGGKPYESTIKETKVEYLRDNTGQKRKKYVLYFRVAKKGLVLNKTLADQVKEVTGQEDSDNWPGQRVTLYPTNVEAFGKIYLVVRIRAAIAAALENLPDEDELADLPDEDDLAEVDLDDEAGQHLPQEDEIPF